MSKKEPKHVTLLSQCDASAQARQKEQVLSSEEKKKVSCWKCNTSHAVTCVISTCALASRRRSTHPPCKVVVPKSPVIAM